MAFRGWSSPGLRSWEQAIGRVRQKALVINECGRIGVRLQQNGGVPRVSLTTDGSRAGDFAVAVYLIAPNGQGMDYIELPLSG